MAKVRSVTTQQIQELDRVAIEQYGIPSVVLMESAGAWVAAEVMMSLAKKQSKKVCVICGVGNNAGDGFVAARRLINVGAKVKIYLLGKVVSLKPDPLMNYNILKKLEYPIQEIQNITPGLKRDIVQSDVVVDAIFGVGLNRKIEGLFKQAIDLINAKARYVLSIDIPSGLDGTTGHIYGVCVKADKTVTFTCAKAGFWKNEGPHHAGQLEVVGIGIPRKLVNKIK
jgi:NAD(P)H-hydrate epimerase